MIPKEKAKELINKYLRTYPIYNNPTVTISYTNNEAKQCALIAVDEILDDDVYDMSEELFEKRIEYWEKVKIEIDKL